MATAETPSVPPVTATPDEGPPAIPLVVPRDGTPEVTETVAALDAAIAALRAGSGPIAVDAERASGFRYGQRAYLVQLRREGAGTFLIDPVALPALAGLGQALRSTEWVLHAASQDLPCLAELGLVPTKLFDTELAARLLGYERVGLATLTERVLGYALAKEHSAADWSTRPLPPTWLAYAALDVELLVDLRAALAAELDDAGKRSWAEQEFAWLIDAPPPPPRAEPWRRVSGIHRVRGRRSLGEVRELWEERDALARQRDVAPGRVLPDATLVAIVQAQATDAAGLSGVQGLTGPRMRRTVSTWWRALERARALPETDLPQPAAGAGDGPPASVARWADRDPEAAARLQRARTALAEIGAERNVPVENLLEPALVRRLAWSPPADASPGGVARALAEGNARPWQVELTAPALSDAFAG
ncbi:MAG TPA: HRDC domain-containing protein [Mycobacteriales bacterium]|nr:HRDC domain-containing protein [Mycobacteriales bacterium]